MLKNKGNSFIRVPIIFFFTEVAEAAETWWTEKRWKNGDSAADGPSAEIEIFSAGIVVDKDKRSRGYWRIDRTDLLLQVICVPISTCACGRGGIQA